MTHILLTGLSYCFLEEGKLVSEKPDNPFLQS